MVEQWDELPPLPHIGEPESYYAKQVKLAEKIGNPHAREANKVGQYVTLALAPRLPWEKKLRYFCHALRVHCVPPPLANDKIWMFYGELAALVRRHAGAEAVRLASFEDDFWAGQLKAGVPRPQIKAAADIFFRKLLDGRDGCPEYLNHEDYDQLRILHKQWM